MAEHPDTNRTPDDEPTMHQWVMALVVVGLIAVVTTVFLIWFAFAFLFQSCCLAPPPAR